MHQFNIELRYKYSKERNEEQIKLWKPQNGICRYTQFRTEFF